MSSAIKHQLGDLEATIMEIVWQLKQASVRQVLTQLKKQRRVAYTTVMTVMSRLYDKGILRRFLETSGAYVYRPTKDRQEFLAEVSKKVISGLIRDYGEVAVAQFIDVLEANNSKAAAKWRRQLKNIR